MSDPEAQLLMRELEADVALVVMLKRELRSRVDRLAGLVPQTVGLGAMTKSQNAFDRKSGYDQAISIAQMVTQFATEISLLESLIERAGPEIARAAAAPGGRS